MRARLTPACAHAPHAHVAHTHTHTRTGAGIDGETYVSVITSYDYDTFISEAGASGQPGVGGEDKYQARARVCAVCRARVCVYVCVRHA